MPPLILSFPTCHQIRASCASIRQRSAKSFEPQRIRGWPCSAQISHCAGYSTATAPSRRHSRIAPLSALSKISPSRQKSSAADERLQDPFRRSRTICSRARRVWGQGFVLCSLQRGAKSLRGNRRVFVRVDRSPEVERRHVGGELG